MDLGFADLGVEHGRVEIHKSLKSLEMVAM